MDNNEKEEYSQLEAREILQKISEYYEKFAVRNFSGNYTHKCKDHNYKYRIEVKITILKDVK